MKTAGLFKGKRDEKASRCPLRLADPLQHVDLITLKLFAFLTAFPCHAGFQFFYKRIDIGWHGKHFDVHIFWPCPNHAAELCDDRILLRRGSKLKVDRRKLHELGIGTILQNNNIVPDIQYRHCLLSAGDASESSVPACA